jgi:hypothetical protein
LGEGGGFILVFSLFGRWTMRRVATFLAVLLLAPAASAAQSIEGVWRLVEREVIGGDDPRVESGGQIQPSFVIYTASHFTYVINGALSPRLPLTLEPTDAELGAVMRTFTAAAGTYGFDGSTLFYYRVAATNPNAMQQGVQPQIRQVPHLTDRRLETSATDPLGVTTILKYTRVE